MQDQAKDGERNKSQVIASIGQGGLESFMIGEGRAVE